jgi:lipase chaperone LimK
MLNKRKVIFILIAAACVIAAVLANRPDKEKRTDATEKIDRYLGITRSGSDGAFINEQYFSEKFSKNIADKNTVDLFKFLQFKFDNDNLEEHFSEVLKYLIGTYGEDKAEELFRLYKKFTSYEIVLSGENFLKRQQPASASEAIEFLNEIKNYREKVFGSELAENLFGDEQRMYEYKILLNEIVNDPDAYGSEKEAEINALKKNTGYEPDEKNEMSELDIYNMKLRLYKKDFSQLNEEKQKELMRKFRSEIFTPDEASRLDQLELHNEQEALRGQGIPDHN